LGVRLLNDDYLFALHCLRFHFHLFVRLQIAFVLGFLAHSLDGVHHLALLRKERVAEVSRPLNIVGESLHDIWKPCHGLHARIPGLFSDRVRQGFILQVLVLPQPLLKLDKFQRVRGRR
jgi:hypothetical protein